MTPLALANTFATVVGLIANFKSERQAASEDEYKDFVTWLDIKRHKAVIEEINSNHLLGLGIKHLLQQNHEEVISKIQALDKSIISLASKFSGFNEIASAISPGTEISNQAISIIHQLDKSGGSVFLEIPTLGGTTYLVLDGNGGSIEMTEDRFIKDDLNTLCAFGLLAPDRNPKGGKLFRITRDTVSFLKGIEQ